MPSDVGERGSHEAAGLEGRRRELVAFFAGGMSSYIFRSCSRLSAPLAHCDGAQVCARHRAGAVRTYTGRVMRVLAVVFLVLIATMPVLDALSCPDGCTTSHRQLVDQNHGMESHDGACLLCTGGYADTSMRAVLAVDADCSTVLLPAERLTSYVPPTLHRPPRA